ncbi:potassium-transporting ATPase subunit KdpA [Sporomusa acidovorans]|uniref:Potassium-transporting ATPase potassium-binding subunit n=1 Tax=Sporomusa acidovorans (strain ATCC 49682 / DSM 3132 / Mol) TaxID=1123286 RepID=A0ABZ3IX03_SPOA4|nr:potassium-transporting ATPase subunit KdpA [Sporomusa acidovorans]OZC23396.1 potassium-transporting ATPase A chain [Sporomusa acidovorans DSM 3132]SDE44260.1 K+-transporting ATPase ATPase A chain [Sporomusa acidovorans]
MASDLTLFGLFFAVLFGLAWPLGRYMAKVFNLEKTVFDPVLRPIEKILYRITGVDDSTEMNWQRYAGAVIWFNLLGMALVFIIQMLQDKLPLNPENLAAVAPWHVAFNTAVSFMTNTNWQAYGGETTMSYFTQMAALTVQNFLSAATGLAVAIAFIRGLTRKTTQLIGNFWVDLTRSVIYILLPISILFSVVLVQQGVPQTLSPYVSAQTLEGAEQKIAVGPVASQEAIKLLGTNGGGFFNANSAHPFENPTPFTNFLETLSIFLIPAGLAFAFGYMVRDRRQGYAVLAAMTLLFLMMLTLNYTSELAGNPLVAVSDVSGSSAMEGKEVRFGIGGTSLFATVTTAASCGAVNAMHDSFTPLGGLVPLLQMMLGEVVFGGVGAGFYGILVFVVLTVFIVGLMVGRTPEYLGKKIDSWEMKMATVAILIPAVTILIGSAVASVTEDGLAGIANPGPHGLSEMLYAFASAAGNNGSAFAGLTVNTLFYDLALALAMLLGRFGVIIPVLAIAGSMAEKKITPPGPGTFPTTGWLFVVLLAAVVLVVSALTFLPALALGPIVEHVLMLQGTTF